MQLEESEDLSTIYAFGLVEYKQSGSNGGKIGLRMQLGGEVKGSNADEVKSCPRLSRMRPLVKESQKTWVIKKVIFCIIYVFILLLLHIVFSV